MNHNNNNNNKTSQTSWFAIRTLGFVITILLSGCAFWPTYKLDTIGKLTPRVTATDDNCKNTGLDSYEKAKSCVVQSLNIVDEMISQTGDFDRGFSYLTIGIASAVGGVMGFNGTKDTLKALGLGSGSLLGINTVIDTNTQRTILTKARDELSCVLRAADAKKQANDNVSSHSENYKVNFEPLIDQIDHDSTKNNKVLSLYESNYSISVAQLVKTLNASTPSIISKQLMTQYLLIISDLRKSLANSSQHADLYQTQKDRVAQMIGDSVRATNKAEEQLNILMSFNINLPSASDNLDALTQPILDVFKDCASDGAKTMQ